MITFVQRGPPDIRARLVEGLLDGAAALERKVAAVDTLRALNDQASMGAAEPSHPAAASFKQGYARTVLATQQVCMLVVCSYVYTTFDTALRRRIVSWRPTLPGWTRQHRR